MYVNHLMSMDPSLGSGCRDVFDKLDAIFWQVSGKVVDVVDSVIIEGVALFSHIVDTLTHEI